MTPASYAFEFQQLFAAHRWLILPVLALIAFILGSTFALVDFALGCASARIIHTGNVVDITARREARRVDAGARAELHAIVSSRRGGR